MRIFWSVLILIFILSNADAQNKISARSESTSLNIRKKKIPPILTISDIKFSDKNNNNRIDGFEDCNISFSISNSGKGAAINLKMNVINQSTVTGLNFQKLISLNTINPGSKIPVNVQLSGTQSLTNGIAVIKISFDEPLGFPPDEFEMKIETKEFQKPNIAVVDYNFLTDNGILKLGLPIQIKTLIQNTGQGIAEEVKVNFQYPSQNVFPNGDEQFNLGALKPNETREVVFEFIANKKYTQSTIAINILLSEKFGRYNQSKVAIATIDAKATSTSITINSNAVDNNTTINQASLTADVDKNIPQNNQKNVHRYALIIGNEDYSKYQNGLKNEANVEFAIADARVFTQYAENTLGIPKENIVLLENAISSVMNREIEKLSKLIGYENGQAEVFFYYAGHGFPDEETKESYIMPVDISGANVIQGIKLSKLYSDLTKNTAKRVSIFLDACFSGGGLESGLLSARSVIIKPKPSSISGNIIVFSASSGEQSSLPYRDKKHGMFTYFLLKSIQESKGNITYKELFENVKRNVEINAIKTNGKDQNPELNFSKVVQNNWENWKLY